MLSEKQQTEFFFIEEKKKINNDMYLTNSEKQRKIRALD
jgi:lipase chaperone LimK